MWLIIIDGILQCLIPSLQSWRILNCLRNNRWEICPHFFHCHHQGEVWMKEWIDMIQRYVQHLFHSWVLLMINNITLFLNVTNLEGRQYCSIRRPVRWIILHHTNSPIGSNKPCGKHRDHSEPYKVSLGQLLLISGKIVIVNLQCSNLNKYLICSFIK